MVKLSEMPCYCPCPFCKRKRPEEGQDDKQKPPEDRRERETDENMSGGNSVGGDSFPIPPIRPGEESELPRHLGPIKQLYASTGFNLAMYKDGTVRGTREQFNKWAVLELSSPAIGEVRIKGVEANLYLMMDDNGYLHAKPDGTTDDTIFLERYDHDSHYNNYISKKHEDKNWYVGIKKSGKPKKASKTAKGQNAVKFLPRPAYPKPTS